MDGSILSSDDSQYGVTSPADTWPKTTLVFTTVVPTLSGPKKTIKKKSIFSLSNFNQNLICMSILFQIQKVISCHNKTHLLGDRFQRSHHHMSNTCTINLHTANFDDSATKCLSKIQPMINTISSMMWLHVCQVLALTQGQKIVRLACLSNE